jgi:hypothetical protein
MEIHGFHAMQHYAVGPNGDYYSMVSRESVAGVAASSKEEEIAPSFEGTSPCLLFSWQWGHCPVNTVPPTRWVVWLTAEEGLRAHRPGGAAVCVVCGAWARRPVCGHPVHVGGTVERAPRERGPRDAAGTHSVL